MFMENEELFEGSPRDKFFDIVYNANRNLVEDKLEEIMGKLAIYETLLEERGVDCEAEVFNYKFEKSNELNALLQNEYMSHTVDIISRNE